jgi:hypothetical protein
MDAREEIIKRLVAIAGTCGATVKRMAVDAHTSERPLIVINDGDESIQLQKGGSSPVIVTLRPQLILVALDGDNPGPAINKLRAKVLKAVLTDDELKTTVGVHGLVKYLGCETGIARGESMEADMALNFEVDYRLTPADL